MSHSRCMATRQSASNAAPADTSNMLVGPSGTVGSVPDASTASTQTPTPMDSLAPGDPLHTVQYISDNA